MRARTACAQPSLLGAWCSWSTSSNTLPGFSACQQQNAAHARSCQPGDVLVIHRTNVAGRHTCMAIVFAERQQLCMYNACPTPRHDRHMAPLFACVTASAHIALYRVGTLCQMCCGARETAQCAVKQTSLYRWCWRTRATTASHSSMNASFSRLRHCCIASSAALPAR